MKPIIKWQTHTTEATAKVLGIELSVKSNGKGKFESTVYCSGIRPEKDHTFETLDDGKAWCEQTLQRWINASFEPVSEPLADTQPTEATELLTLIERIQPILDDLMMECFKHGFHQSEMTEAEFIDYSRKNCVPLKREIISILKQHEAENRLETNNDAD